MLRRFLLGLVGAIVLTLLVGMPAEPVSAYVAPTGEIKIAVIVYKFQEGYERQTIAWVEGKYFNNADSVNAFYQEASYGKAWLTGDVYGYYTVAGTSSICDLDSWPLALAAADSDVPYTDYDLVVFLPSISVSCGRPTGSVVSFTEPDTGSTMDGNVVLVWEDKIPAHEIGHNLGPHLWESFSYHCASALSGYCESIDYGDWFTVMGTNILGATLHFNAVEKDLLGWVDAAKITTVTVSDSYTLQAIERNEVGDKLVLKLPNSVYLEYRRKLGFDNNLTMYADYEVLIHQPHSLAGYVEGYVAAHLLDTTPGSLSMGTDHIDAGLAVNESACIRDLDGDDDVRIDVTATSDTTATVYVEVGDDCTLTRAEIAEMVYGGPYEDSACTYTGASSDAGFGFYYCADPDTTSGPHYTDVSTDHPSYEVIETLYNNGVIWWASPGLLQPYLTATRAETAVMAVLGSQIDISISGGAPHFPGDVPSTYWAYDHIETLCTYEVIDCSGSTFNPEGPITEANAEVIIEGVRDIDVDDDGFGVGPELYMGTDPDDDCATTRDVSLDEQGTWPVDFDNNQVSNIQDIAQLTPPTFNTACGDSLIVGGKEVLYSARKDFNTDCVVNILDIVQMTSPIFNSLCPPLAE